MCVCEGGSEVSATHKVPLMRQPLPVPAMATHLKYSPVTFFSCGSVARRMAHWAPSKGFFMNSHIHGKVINLTQMADISGELTRKENKSWLI